MKGDHSLAARVLRSIVPSSVRPAEVPNPFDVAIDPSGELTIRQTGECPVEGFALSIGAFCWIVCAGTTKNIANLAGRWRSLAVAMTAEPPKADHNRPTTRQAWALSTFFNSERVNGFVTALF
jgi:hypothetical protein